MKPTKSKKPRRKELFKEKILDNTNKHLKENFKKEVILKPEYYDVN